MSDSRKVKASSVAAFLFMPQFHLSYGQMRFIVPVFMRTLALSFVQAGLLPYNHPATRYGIEGVRKYSFGELMAEAWFTLRTTRATPAQWGVFMAVAGFVCLMAAALITAILRFALGVGNVARAQIFDGMNGATDQASVAAAGYIPAGGMFDKSLAAPGGHADYAIMILDKIFRQGIDGTGGALQNAVGALMQIYNTGVMVVAAVILFWIILSVVVDTAKTGVLGGGRHNMVWAPIRIVFALGLLIPLGNVGFSSGQFMVMKLAEWGSNFGSRAWVTYVSAVLTNKMVVERTPDNPTALVTAYTGMWVCLLANNGYLEWGVTQATAPDQIVQQVRVNTGDIGTTSFSFTNKTTKNLCGTVTYKTPLQPTLVYTLAAGDPLNAAAAKYREEIILGWTDELFGVIAPTASIASFDDSFVDKAFELKSRDLACAFVGEYIPPDGAGVSPLDIDCASYSACSAGGPWDGDFPDAGGAGLGCIQDIVSTIYGGMAGKYATAMANLNAAVAGGALLASVQQDGWAGMGIWYHKINQINLAVSSTTQPTVQIAAGTVANASASGGAVPSHVKFTADVVAAYNEWWQTAPAVTVNAAAAAQPANLGGRQAAPSAATSSVIAPAAKGIIKSLITADPRGVLNAVAELVTGDFAFKNFFFDILEPGDTQIYPLAELAATGTQIMAWGIGLLGAVTVFSLAISAGGTNLIGKAFGGEGIASALVQGPIIEGISTIGSLMLIVGMVLSYYVPIIPFMRVAFAVLTWMISVFEAVVMVPIAALAHLTTEGEGLSGSAARNAWILWLNVLMRPVLTVVGYIGAMMIFNTFVIFFHHTFLKTAIVGMTDSGFVGFLSMLTYSALYVATIYTVANSSFKLLDLIPNALMRWMGGSADTSFEDSAAEGYLIAGGKMVGGLGSSWARGLKGGKSGSNPGSGASGNPNSPNFVGPPAPK